MSPLNPNRSGLPSVAANGTPASPSVPGLLWALAAVVVVVAMPPPSAADGGSSLVVVARPQQRMLLGLDGRPVEDTRPVRVAMPAAPAPPVAPPVAAPSIGARVHATAPAFIPTCAVAWRLGLGRARVGEPGYAPHLDRDGDGVACEIEPGTWQPRASVRR